MVKGIFLKQPPCMHKYSETDVLADIDFLNEINKKDNKELGYLNYLGEKFEVLLMKMEEKEKRDSMIKVANTLQNASPELIKTFVLDDVNVIVAFPSLKRYLDGDNKIYSFIIEELLRVTTFLLSFPDWTDEQVINYLKVYINLFIKWVKE